MSVLFAFGWAVERSINEHFIQQDVDELNAVAQALKYTMTTLPSDTGPEQLRQRLAKAVSGHHNVQYSIAFDTGNQVYATPGFFAEQFASFVQPVSEITSGTVATWQNEGQTYRVAVLQTTSEEFPELGALTITVAMGIDFHLHYLEDFGNYLRLIIVLACLIAILATWFLVYQGHAPIRRISSEIRRVRSDQLHIRLEPDAVPVELVELALSFNDMLERLEDVFRRLSDFSGDIAHELRTPITNLNTQTQVALSQSRSVEQYREVLYSNLEEYERMAKMVSDMLFLAKADNNLLKPELVKIDFEEEVAVLFDYFGAWAEDQEVDLEMISEQVCILGDRLMVRRALSNLLSNAIRHCPAGGRVAVQFGAASDEAWLHIQNSGVVIPAEHLVHIFDRFYRPDASRQRSGEGAGLGLAIVKSIIEAHGGNISAHSTTELTTFEIRLPAIAC